MNGYSVNSGYYGYSMSWGAIDAYERGLLPISKWTKGKIIDALEKEGATPEQLKAFRCFSLKDLKEIALEIVEWHHTSKFFNKTNFYDINEDCLEYTPDALCETAKKKKLLAAFLKRCEKEGCSASILYMFEWTLVGQSIDALNWFVENYPFDVIPDYESLPYEGLQNCLALLRRLRE